MKLKRFSWNWAAEAEREMSRFLRIMSLWLWGGAIYYAIELCWRGYSHESMFIVGGICFLILGVINNYLPWNLGLAWQALIGAVSITAVELLSGLIINRWLGLGVWDYSDVPFNILGQVCLPYTVAWIFLSAIGIYLDDYLRWRLYDEQKPKYFIFKRGKHL